MNNKDFLYKELSYQIIGAAMKIHRRLGSFLPEHCYQHALVIEFHNLGIHCTEQQCFQVYYDEKHCGHFFTDVIVDNKVILELKSDEYISKNHLSQLFTYLRISKLHVGYILNFGRRSLEFRRLIL